MGIKPTVSVKGNFKNVKKVQNKLKVFEKTLPVKVGVFASAGNYDQTGVSLVEVAAINEFGSEKAHIPERSFLRQPLRNGGSELRKIAIRVVKAVLEEKMEFQPGMKILGEWGVKTCKNAITDGDGSAFQKKCRKHDRQ